MMNFIEKNIFIDLRSTYFHTNEKMEEMTRYKQKRIEKILKNIQEMPDGEIRLSNPIFNRRLTRIEHDERHAIDTSIESIELLQIIIANVDSIMNHCISLTGIIRLGSFLRTVGDKVDFVKIDNWLAKLHMQRMAQFQGSILILFFKFEPAEIPFVHKIERGAENLTLKSLNISLKDMIEEWHFKQGESGFVHNNNAVLRHNLNHSLCYMDYAPVETISHFFIKFVHSLSEIEE